MSAKRILTPVLVLACLSCSTLLVLSMIQHRHKHSIDYWCDLCLSTDITIRQEAILFLMEVLNDANSVNRIRAARCLSRLEKPPREVYVVLGGILQNDHDPHNRMDAALALGRLGSDAIEWLRVGLKDPNETVRGNVRGLLSQIEPNDAAVQVLVEMLDDPDAARSAVPHLARVGPAAAVAIPKLERLQQGCDLEMRMATAWALYRIDKRATEAVSTFVAALRSENEYTRASCVQALGRMGPDAVSATPELIRSLKDECRYVRIDAIRAIPKVGVAPEIAVPALKAVLEDGDKRVQAEAVVALKGYSDNPGQR